MQRLGPADRVVDDVEALAQRPVAAAQALHPRSQRLGKALVGIAAAHHAVCPERARPLGLEAVPGEHREVELPAQRAQGRDHAQPDHAGPDHEDALAVAGRAPEDAGQGTGHRLEEDGSGVRHVVGHGEELRFVAQEPL